MVNKVHALSVTIMNATEFCSQPVKLKRWHCGYRVKESQYREMHSNERLAQLWIGEPLKMHWNASCTEVRKHLAAFSHPIRASRRCECVCVCVFDFRLAHLHSTLLAINHSWTWIWLFCRANGEYCLFLALLWMPLIVVFCCTLKIYRFE